MNKQQTIQQIQILIDNLNEQIKLLKELSNNELKKFKQNKNKKFLDKHFRVTRGIEGIQTTSNALVNALNWAKRIGEEQ